MRKGSTKREIFIHVLPWPGQYRVKFHTALLCLLVSICLLPLFARAQTGVLLASQSKPAPQQSPSPTPPPSPTPVQPIPLPQIADQAEALDRLLRDVSKELAPVLPVRVSDPEAKAHAEEVRLRASQTDELLTGLPNMMQLQDEDRYWRSLSEEYGSQRKALTARAAGIEKQLALLDAEQARWEVTLAEVRGKPGLELVAERVERELAAIHKVRSEAQEQRNVILTLQNRISEQDKQIAGVLLKLDETHERLRGQLFVRDSYPLWSARELRASDQSISTVIYHSAGRGFTGSATFLRSSQGQIVGAIVLYICALGLAFYFKRYIATAAAGTVSQDAALVFSRPFSVALQFALLTSLGITTSAPTGISFIVCLALLIPVLRLLPKLINRPLRHCVYAISAFYVIEWAHLILQFSALFKRELFAINIFLASLVFGWLARPSRLSLSSGSGWKHKLLILGIRAGFFMLVVSFGANILGFVSLSQILGVGTLFSGFSFAFLYTMVRVAHLGLSLFVDSPWFRALPEANAEVVERWGARILGTCALLIWLDINLYFFTVLDRITKTLQQLLEYPIGFGKVHFTMGGTLTLFLSLFVGYLVANVAKFVLQEMLLPKFSLRSGLGYAISRVTYYILIVGIFVAAVTNAGVELNKFTLLTGALGLGVGFGLQNIVNNFASGLIILFERPFRVGDTVEVGGVTGTVKRIGARSSTILTFQYAEVIVPNSNLLSDQVINWTLTSARRRVEIPVSVAYGTDLDLALRLLIDVAIKNPRILRDPSPEAFFLGFGESALNLELRFWAAQPVWFELKSEVGLAVLRVLREAGIEIPFPQRDLHVRSVDIPARKEGEASFSTGNIKKMASGQ